MSSLKSKILVSGCGITFSRQLKKTWPCILQAVGLNLIDVAGPAVSNQWILDESISTLLDDIKISHAVIQLTSLHKLDVEIIKDRYDELVKPDSLRNFTHHGVWPSSASEEHISKKLWKQYLYSPSLCKKDIYVKLVLLHKYCESRGTKLLVYQGYPIDWSDHHRINLRPIISNIDGAWMDDYQKSSYYEVPDPRNSVPNIRFHFEIAKKIASDLQINIHDRITKLEKDYYDKKIGRTV